MNPPSDSSSDLYAYPRPSLTADLALFTFAAGKLQALLIRRKHDPYAGLWALPGGFVNINEAIESAAARELFEETGMAGAYLEQLYTYGEPGRDPRGRVVTVAYLALVGPEAMTQARAGDDAAETGWFDIYDPPGLAFDHGRILSDALARLRAKLKYTALGFLLLPKEFTLSEVQQVYEAALREPLDKRNFRRKILAQGILESTGKQRYGDHRPARLYRISVTTHELEKAGRRFP